MKKTTVLLFLTLLCSSVFAQRYSTSSNINFSAGYLENGYVLSLGYEKMLSEKASLNFDLNYMERKQDVKNTNINAKLNSYYLSGKYKFYIPLQNSIHPFISGGLFGGREEFKNEKDFPNTLKVNLENGFIYGVISDIGLEYNMRSISLVVSTTPLYEFSNKKFLIPVKVGLKYYF